MPIVYRKKNEHEQQMLMNLHKSKWQDSLTIGDFEKCKQQNIDSIKNMVKLAKVTFHVPELNLDFWLFQITISELFWVGYLLKNFMRSGAL